MGVRRAVEMALDAVKKRDNPIFTYGPLIHNTQVLDLLAEKGITILNDIPVKGAGTVIIRAHGVPPETKTGLKSAGFNVIDATCPRVIKVQSIIQKHAKKGFASIIIGDRNHPEVTGLLGFAGNNGHVVETPEELDKLSIFDKAVIVAQTTQNTVFFDLVIKWASQKKTSHYKIFNTICDSTFKRQSEVRRLAEDVDAFIIVGGKSSGNTRRLVETAIETGKPAFHIETESELDPAPINSIGNIGITAGASTPNWIINKVYRKLESMPKKARKWRGFLFNLERFLLLTNIFVALGAGSLSYASMKLLGFSNYFHHVSIAFLYVLSMHIFNNLTGGKADRYNDPDRAAFYEKYKALLSIMATISGVAGLAMAYTMGWLPFLILLVMNFFGILYNFRFIPKRFEKIGLRSIKDIPGSKTALIAVAWGIITSILPSLSVHNGILPKTCLVFIWSTGIVFVRTAFFDILDIQGDRIVGKETLPIFLGEKQTMRLLKFISGFVIVLLFVSVGFKFITSLGLALAVIPVFLMLVILAYEQGNMLPGMRLEFFVETHFVLTGVIAYCF